MSNGQIGTRNVPICWAKVVLPAPVHPSIPKIAECGKRSQICAAAFSSWA